MEERSLPGRARIGSSIREYRKGRRWSQKELADRIGVSRNTIVNWESGRTRPDIKQIGQLMRVLEMSPREVLELREGTESTEDMRLISDIRRLSAEDRQVVEKMVVFLLERREEKQDKDSSLKEIYRIMICYRMSESGEVLPGYCFVRCSNISFL